MKKIFLTSLLAVFAVSSVQAADFFVGGGASLNMDETHSNVMGISPEVGWKYNDNWDLGLGASINYNRNDADNGRYSYGVDVFARYKIAQFGDFKLLLRGDFGAGFVTLASENEALDGETASMLRLSVAPMVTYDVSESFTLYANLNFLGVNAGYTFENDKMGIEDGWTFNAFADSSNVLDTGAFQIGFLYNF